MFENKNCIVVMLVVVLINVLQCNSLKVKIDNCKTDGFQCTKLGERNWLVVYNCLNDEPVVFEIWHYNFDGKVKHLRIENCPSVEINLRCKSEAPPLHSIHIRNVSVLTFTDLMNANTNQLPESVFIEDVQSIPIISERTFKQFTGPPAAYYGCVPKQKPVNNITFSNVNIGTIQQNAFYNLTDVKIFRWENVRVDTMAPLALQVQMVSNTLFGVSNSSFNMLDYKAFTIRCPTIIFVANAFTEITHKAIDAVSSEFIFYNNTVKEVHSFAYLILSQYTTFGNNTIDSLQYNALQGIGPGLLENAWINFGQLKFIYNFENNTIYHSHIDGLHPDVTAYNNVRSNIYVASNVLPWTCKELAWFTVQDTVRNESTEFNRKLWHNNNVCQNFSSYTITVKSAASSNLDQREPPISFCHGCNATNTTDLGAEQNESIVLNTFPNGPVQHEDTDFDTLGKAPKEPQDDDID